MIAQQKEQLKNDIDKRLAEYNGGVEKFAARWHQLKPAVRQNDLLFEPCSSSKIDYFTETGSGQT
eukprot:COSAG06_NODE_1302_length_9933_cov_7.954342_12_plen_65_part_00